MTVAETQPATLSDRIYAWRTKHLSERQLIILLAFVVGVLTAVSGLLLKWLIKEIEMVLTDKFDVTSANPLYLIYPVVGIYLTSLFVRHVVKDDISHGVTKILYAISKKQSRIKSHNTWSSVIASAITIGFGGSVGAEAPIVLTGSAIGSQLGVRFRLDNHTLMILVGCGAAGAVAGIFKAPIAGLVFTLEVLMVDLTMTSLLPLLVSCATAAAVTYAFTGTNSLLEFHLDNSFEVGRIPTCIMLGVLCGLVSLYFTRATNAFEDVFRKYDNPYIKLALGGVVLSVLIYLFPPLYGEGYGIISLLINGTGMKDWSTVMNNSFFYGYDNLLLVYLSLIILMKVFASTATNGGGGCGGIFAPSLFLGCITGFVFSRFWNQYQIGTIIPEKNYALYGMCGLMSGVMHAPLTGIFLIAELTGGYALIVPLMIVSVCSYLTIIAFEPHSIYSMRLAKKGQLITHNKDNAILTLMSLDSVIDKMQESVTPEDDLGHLATAIADSKYDVFPVVNRQGTLLGIVLLDDIRGIMFRQELYHRFRVDNVMRQPKALLFTDDPMRVVMQKFDDTGAWILPVVDNESRFVGFITKSKLYSTYRQMMVDLSDE
jgi:chloride channel protein, CIC family